MGDTVYKECNVECCAEAAHEARPERDPKALVPEIKWHQNWECNCNQGKQRDVVSVGEKSKNVTFKLKFE